MHANLVQKRFHRWTNNLFKKIIELLQRQKMKNDPVTIEKCRQYTIAAKQEFDNKLLKELNEKTGGLAGKRVIDIAGGPGLYSIEMAKMDAEVTWYDISKNYMIIAKSLAAKAGVDIEYRLGVMDDVTGEYDIVLNRQSWFYCLDDLNFARTIYNLVKKGGWAYISIPNESFLYKMIQNRNYLMQLLLLFQYRVNDLGGMKIGHPVPSHTRIQKIWSKFKCQSISIYRNEQRSCSIVIFKT